MPHHQAKYVITGKICTIFMQFISKNTFYTKIANIVKFPFSSNALQVHVITNSKNLMRHSLTCPCDRITRCCLSIAFLHIWVENIILMSYEFVFPLCSCIYRSNIQLNVCVTHSYTFTSLNVTCHGTETLSLLKSTAMHLLI